MIRRLGISIISTEDNYKTIDETELIIIYIILHNM
jgi:hypothetical protein